MARPSRPLIVCGAGASLLLLVLWFVQSVGPGAPVAAPRTELEPARAPSSEALDAVAGEARAPVAVPQAESARKAPRRRVLRGSVTSGRGAPVEDANVTLQRHGSPGADDSVLTDEKGQFLLRYTGAGDYELIARAAGLGVTPLQVLQLPDDPSALEEVELAIAEPDFLAGVLEDQEGHALSGVELWIFPAQLAQADSEQLFAWRGSGRSRTLRGATSAFTTTDQVGRFRVEGLAPGRYFFTRPSDLDPPHAARLFYGTGSDSIRLRFEGDCWLRISCRDARGASAPDARYFCAPLLVSGPSDLMLDPTSERASEGGELLFRVEPCRVYRCGFLDPERGLVEADISVPCLGGTSERVFTFPERSGSGSLVLDLPQFSIEAQRVPRRVRVRSASSGVLLLSWTQTGWSNTRLPQAEYLLEVADPPARHSEVFVRDNPFGEQLLARRAFAIEDGLETRLEVR